MAIYHLSCKIGSKAKGQSAVAAAAYRSGEKIKREADGLNKNYSRRQDVEWSQIFLPQNAPERFRERSILWNAVEDTEAGNPSAQLWREFEVALPVELDVGQQIALAKKFAERLVKDGMIADVCFHNKTGNPHLHIMCPMREVDQDGNFLATKSHEVFANDRDENGKAIFNPDKPYYNPKDKATAKYRIPKLDKDGNQKVRERKGKGKEKIWEKVKVDHNDWNKIDKLREWRKSWEACCNEALNKAGVEERIDCRSYNTRKIYRKPKLHEGYAAREIEKRGGKSELVEINKAIDVFNELAAEKFGKQERPTLENLYRITPLMIRSFGRDKTAEVLAPELQKFGVEKFELNDYLIKIEVIAERQRRGDEPGPPTKDATPYQKIGSTNFVSPLTGKEESVLGNILFHTLNSFKGEGEEWSSLTPSARLEKLADHKFEEDY